MEDDFKWTLEDEVNYFRSSFLDLKAAQDRSIAVLQVLLDFIKAHQALYPKSDILKLIQDVWKIENENQPSI